MILCIGWLVKLSDFLVRIVSAVVVALTLVMLTAIGWQIFMRYVFNRPPSWTEELALLCFTWVSLLMLALGVRQAFHARIDLLANQLPRSWSDALNLLVLMMTAGFGAYLCLGGVTYVIETASSVSAAIAYPIYALHFAAPVCGALVFFFALEQFGLSVPSFIATQSDRRPPA